MAITATINASLGLSGDTTGPESIPLPTETLTASVNCRKTLTVTTSFQSLATLVGTIPTGTSGFYLVTKATPASTNNVSYGVSGTVAEVLSGGTTPLTWVKLGYNSGLTQGLQMTGAAAASLSVELIFF